MVANDVRVFFSLQVTKEELAKLVQGYEKKELLTSGGVTLAGQRFIYLSGTDCVIRAKLGKIGVHCMKTNQGKKSFFLNLGYWVVFRVMALVLMILNVSFI